MNRDSDISGVIGALMLLFYLVALGVYVGRRYDGFMALQNQTAQRLFLLEHPELADVGRDGSDG